MFATRMAEVCKYGRYLFTLDVLCSKLIEEGQKQEVNILAVEKEVHFIWCFCLHASLFPHLSAKVSCLLTHVVYCNIQGITPFLFSSLQKRGGENGISNGIRLLFIT